MNYDTIVIGGGLSGLTAASLLAKRGQKVAVIDKNYMPGGSCGIFRRNHITFDIGAAMLYGFGEKGFNAHRFVFNCLEEPIDMIRHDLLYCVNFKGHRIRFFDDLDKFADELSRVFPNQQENIHRFYQKMHQLYQHIMVETPTYTTADETDRQAALKSIMKHPISYARFLGFLNKSARWLLEQYFSDPEIFKFFDKLTSTYCYTTVDESPAVLAAVMFVDNHIGGSYYPAGSTLFLPGKLEKVIEEHGGNMLYNKEVTSLIFEGDRMTGVMLNHDTPLYANDIIYSGTIWNLYGKLLDESHASNEKKAWADAQVPTYPSVMIYTVVDKKCIPEDTAPVEMLVGNPDQLDESEVTAYILSIDDRTLCGDDEHTVCAIGPSFETWHPRGTKEYRLQKEKEIARLIAVLEKRFPGFGASIRYTELATPATIERYAMKNGGAVAGPKQMLGQHMFHRLHTRTEWDNFFCCGESTVMGTGTPTVTTSGLSAANAVLKKHNLSPFTWQPNMKNYVRIVPHPFTRDKMFAQYPEQQKHVMAMANQCRYCEHPTCSQDIDVRGVMRRLTVGNFTGARNIWQNWKTHSDEALQLCESRCINNIQRSTPVPIKAISAYFQEVLQ